MSTTAFRGAALAALLFILPTGTATMSYAEDLPAPVAACASAEHRQFDFWLGEWDVTDPTGKALGHNKIVRADTGCWITENWRGASGYTGSSLNGWDSQHKLWRQFWIGSDGIILRIEGGIRDNVMVMDGELPKEGGGVQLQRISWTPAADGSVTQKWDTSDDGGKTWKEAFLGIYRKAMAK